MLIPTRRRTWGPEGHTPRIPYSYKHDRISALAVLTVSPIRRHIGLYARFQQDNFKAMHVAPFLRQNVFEKSFIQGIVDGASRWSSQ